MKPIRFEERSEPSGSLERNALVLRADPSRRVVLRFHLTAREPEDVEALRYARRAMIRQERTRGLNWEEPSIENPTFTPTEIRWAAITSQGGWCRQKVAELVERANRARQAMRRLKS